MMETSSEDLTRCAECERYRAENELLVEAVIFGCTCSPTGMSGDRICKRCLWLEGRDDG